MIIAPDSPVNRAMQFEKLMEGTGQIVVANNTLWNTGSGVRIWDALVLSRDVRFCNNLFLGLRDDDFVIVGAPETVNAGFPPGDVKSLLARWKFDRNWRRERTSKPDGKRGSWIPPTSRDEKYKTVRILSRNPSSPDFLRPAAKSPLATEGAGKTDPSLPIYVGAVPPKGTPAWDWDRTWRMPPGKHSVLTVSKDTEDGAQYDSINDALKAANPWDTIRVLDAAIYSEHIVLDDPAKHAGLVLESAKGATIRLAPGSTRVLEIWGVPHVRVTGFRLDGTAEGLLINHVRILNHAPGVILEGLTIQAANPSRAILIQNVAVARTEEPLVVRNCIIEPMQADDQLDGITIVGPLAGAGADATGGILIQNNRVAKARRGILLVGELRDVHVVGNRVWKADQAGMQFEDLHSASRGILLANNTAFDCLFGVRIWDNSPYESFTSGQVQISNNLLQSTVGNMRFVLFGSGKNSAGDGPSLLKFWRIDHNLLSYTNVAQQPGNIPVAPGDKTFSEIRTASLDPNSPDFLRPKKKFPLANGGAGGDLPKYAGAVPPAGTKPWDWNVTWRSRMMRAKYQAKRSKKTTESKE